MSIAAVEVTERPLLAEATDSQLVAAVRRGDDRAFEALYHRYHRRIAAYVYGMVSDYGRAEDITQEVFISALRRMRETERPIAFKPWIYEIAKNACIDQFRRSRRAEEVSYDAEDGLGAADYGRLVARDGAPDQAVENKQQLAQLCASFEGLSDSHHEILVLRELEGLSYREIGERMGLTRPSVESTLFRARRRLTEEFDELATGERCRRIVALMEQADGELGTRDSRRVGRHVSHCLPCRRHARALGVDTTVWLRQPLRREVAQRVAALLPLPAFLRARGRSSDESVLSTLNVQTQSTVAQWSAGIGAAAEPLSAGWGKAAATAAAVVAASVGAAVGTQGSAPLPETQKPQRPAPAAAAQPTKSEPTRRAKPSGPSALPATPGPTATTAAPAKRRSAAPASASTPAQQLVVPTGPGAPLRDLVPSSDGDTTRARDGVVSTTTGVGNAVNDAAGALGGGGREATGGSDETVPGEGKVFETVRDAASNVAGEQGADLVDTVQDALTLK